MSEIEVFEVQCAACESDFQIDSTMAGSTVHCPNCESPAEIPTMAEIMGEDEPPAPRDGATEQRDASETPVFAVELDEKKSPSGEPEKTGGRKKRRPPADKRRPSGDGSPSSGSRSTRDGGNLVKAVSARRSAQLLLKLSDIFYYLACFVLVAWSVKVVGMLYPIVNTKRGSYGMWFVESMSATAWGITFIALLIGAAELFKVVVYVYERTNQDE